MEVVFESALDKSWGIKEALLAVHGIPNIPFGIVRIYNQEQGIQGKVLIADAKYILGTQLVDSTCKIDAYTILKSLFSTNKGNITYLDAGSERPYDFGTELFIPLDNILNNLANLPENSNELFDQTALLNKVFGQEQQISYKLDIDTEKIAKDIKTVIVAPPQQNEEKSNLQTAAMSTKAVISDQVTVSEASSFHDLWMQHLKRQAKNVPPETKQLSAKEQKVKLTKLRTLLIDQSRVSLWRAILRA